MGEPLGLLDEHVDGLGAAVAQPVGGEVGEDLSPPGAQGPSQPGDLGERAGREAGDDLLGQRSALAQAAGARLDGAELLVAGPGQLDLAVRVAKGKADLELAVLALGQVLQTVPEQSADLVERVVLVAAPAGLFLLHAGADLVDDLGAELDDVEGVQDLHGVGEAVRVGRWGSSGEGRARRA